MFLALLYSLIIHQTVTLANPYHKYPYVFLLDIGNEELQTKSEQIRVSVPGGSLAFKYPATGEGDSIAHVRVSGIDFDNDLKASIVEGGPGYKYVVIVFMGNPGRAYDAVVTVSTLDDGKDTENEDQTDTGEVRSSYKVAEDSVEDSNDSAETEENKNEENNEQLTAASNFYDSAENGDTNGKEDESEEDINVKCDESVKIEDQTNDSDSEDVPDYADANDQKEQNDYDDANAPRAEKYNMDEEYDTDDSGDNSQVTKELDRSFYDRYNALRPRLYDYAKVPEEVNNAENEVNYNDGVVYSPEDPVELDQMFNDEEVHNDREKYNDSNGNYADADNSAVAY